MNGDKKALSCSEKRKLAIETVDVPVPANTSYGEFVTTSFTNSYLPRIYYFVVMDCEHITHMTYKMMPKIEVDFNIVSQAGDGETVDHFSYEE